jgi:hypothetical protein
MLNSFKANLRFSRLYKRSRYAEALAIYTHNKSENFSTPDNILWANYQLGLYSTVIGMQWNKKQLKGGIAMAVSLAACGRFDAVISIVKELRGFSQMKAYAIYLSDALAPYMPELALSILVDYEFDESSYPLYISLLLKNKKNDEAAILVKSLLNINKDILTIGSDFPLIVSNAISESPCDQINWLNSYLRGYKLSPLVLRKQDGFLGVKNLNSIEIINRVSGPLVTILMTSYNTSDRIGFALESILNQSYHNIEIIVVDDASTDNTAEIVMALAEVDNRIRYISLPVNVGTYVAKQIGFQLSSGDFLTCHDSDDWSHPLRIELQVQPLIKNSRLVATTSNWVRLQDNGIFYARPVHPLMRLNPASPLFRRELVEREAGLWDTVRTGADSEFHARLRLVFGKKAVKRINLPLTFGAHRDNSLMTAPSTGNLDNRMSSVRLEYWEAWNYWHIDMLGRRQKPRMPKVKEGFKRPFPAPSEIDISEETLLNILATNF